mgnify:FL=1
MFYRGKLCGYASSYAFSKNTSTYFSCLQEILSLIMEIANEKEKLKEQKSEFEKVIKDVFEGILETYVQMVNNIK